MNSFFILVLLLSVVGLIVGIVKPSLIKIQSRKKAVSIFIILILVSFIGTAGTTKKTITQEAPSVEQKSITVEDKISSLAKEANSTKVFFSSLEKSKEEQGSIIVNLNISSYYSKESLHKDLGNLSGKIFNELFKSDNTVNSVSVQYAGEKMDKYGNKTNGNLIVHFIDKKTFTKVNWQNFQSDKLCEFLRSEATADMTSGCTIFVDNLR